LAPASSPDASLVSFAASVLRGMSRTGAVNLVGWLRVATKVVNRLGGVLMVFDNADYQGLINRQEGVVLF